MKKTLLLLMAVFLLSACSQEEMPQNPVDNDTTMQTGMLLNRVMEVAKASHESFFGTRGNELKIASVEPFIPGRASTRSADDSSIFYLINFSNDKGFAIVSDTDTPQLYAISDEGNVHLSDTVENKNFGFYVNELLPEYL